MKLKYILMLLWGIFIYIFIFYISPYYSKKHTGCSETREAYAERIKAVVKKKFIDSSQHNFETIIYEDGDAFIETRKVFSDTEYGDLYDFLKVGDSIIKEKNSYLYRIKSATTKKDTVFKFETLCKDSPAKSR